MELGFSTLSLFSKTADEIINTTKTNKFDSIELLAEGPYSGDYFIKNKTFFKSFVEDDSLIKYIHGPTVDLNLASINPGIRKESVRQILRTVDLASFIGGSVITIHPGKIGRIDKRIRKAAVDYLIDSINEIMDYADELSVKVAVENMPFRDSFLGNSVEELEFIQSSTGCFLTIDVGHANTCKCPADFLDLKNIGYCHLNDNDGIKDKHYSLGKGSLDLNILKSIDKGIIELNNFDNVLKSRDVILNI